MAARCPANTGTAHNVGMRYPFEVNLVGDSKATLEALLPMLKRKKHGAWRKKAEKDTARWWDVMERRAAVEADPINPEYVVHSLDALLPDDVILAADSGSAANWYARHLRMRGTMRGSLSGTPATMGPGVPYVIGAKFAHPGYWQEWQDPRLIVAVLNNQDLNQVTWQMRAMSGAPQFLPSQAIPDVPYADFARPSDSAASGLSSPPRWKRPGAGGRPALRDRLPHRPGRPAHSAARHARAGRSVVLSVIKGDSDRGAMIKQGIKAKVQEFLPGRHGHDAPGTQTKK